MPWWNSLGVEAADRRLLAAVLGAGAGEDAADLAHQRPCDAQSWPVEVHEALHPGEATLPNRVGVPKMIASASASCVGWIDRDVAEARLGLLRVHLLEDLVREQSRRPGRA